MNIDSSICYISVTSVKVKTEEEVVVLADAEDNGDEAMKKSEAMVKDEDDDNIIELEPGTFTSRYQANFFHLSCNFQENISQLSINPFLYFEQ